MVLAGKTDTDASEAEQHVRGCLSGSTVSHAQAEHDCCDCRSYVDILLLELLMSPKPIVANPVVWNS